MKLFKVLGVTIVFSFTMMLSSCNFTRDLNTFWTVYTIESRNMNYLFANNTRETQFMGNVIDGLLETDRWGNLVPAMADPEFGDDEFPGFYREEADRNGTDVYEFHFQIRTQEDGTPYQWVNHRGQPQADIVAYDWLTATRWVLNPFNTSENLNIWIQLIYGVEDFIAQTVQLQQNIVRSRVEHGNNHPITQSFVRTFENMFENISEYVGVRVEEIEGTDTLIFTTNGRLQFFPGSLTANAFFPVSAELLDDTRGLFAQTYRDVWFNGGYFISSHARYNNIVMERNELNWDAENVHIPRINMRFLNAPDPSTQRVLFQNGELDQFNVNLNDHAAVERYITGPRGTVDAQGNYHDVINPYYPGAFTRNDDGEFVRPGLFNFTRNLSNFSGHDQASLNNTQAALATQEFRQAFVFAIDWVEWVYNRFEGSLNGHDWRTSMWTLPGLARADYDGEPRDYTWFFAERFMRDRDLGDMSIDEVRNNLIPGGTIDLLYNEENSRAVLLAAYNELKAQNIEFPIIVETPSQEGATNHNLLVETAAAITDYWNDVLREHANVASNFEFVQFRYVRASGGNWSTLIAGHFDFKFPNAGWGATVGDPIQYAAVFSLDGGAWIPRMGLAGTANAGIAYDLLGEYTRMVRYANATVGNMDDRFRAFADAEYELLFNQAVVVPGMLDAQTVVVVSRILPFTNLRDSLGISHRKFKHQVLIDEDRTATRIEAEKLEAAWEYASGLLTLEERNAHLNAVIRTIVQI